MTQPHSLFATLCGLRELKLKPPDAVQICCRGGDTADTETTDPSIENQDLRGSLFKVWSNVYNCGIFPIGNSGCLPRGKPAVLPNLQYMLGVLVFP